MYKPILEPRTDIQNQLLFQFYKFRFFTVNQLQQIYNHRDSHRIREWLTDLKEKGYLSVIVDKKDPTIPHIFCLTTKARYILQENEDCDKTFLGRLYKERGIKEIFRKHLLNIVDVYIYFLSQQGKDSTLHFLTQQDLMGYDFFPDEKPDVYIAVENKEGTEKYFLDVFDEYRNTPGKIRFAVRNYISFNGNGDWQANTENSQFPSLLFILANDRRKGFVHHYGKYKLEKTFEDISLFVTTFDSIKFNRSKNNIWQKVG